MKAFWQRLHLWFWGKFFIFLVALGCGLRRRRMSHNNGVAGRGTLRIVDNPQFPASDFFEPGRVFPCRIRHACVAYWDDAMKAVRSGSLKFADSDFASPLDIQMNTGDYCFFWNARSFIEFAFSRQESGGIQYVKYYHKWADGRRSAASSIIRAPSSYTQMYYHSHTPFGWRARDGKLRYVRFRLIPADRGPMSSAPDPNYIERARLDPEMAGDVGNQRRLAEEKRDVNYLKKEWRERVAQHGAQYILQIQWHDVSPDDAPEIRNPLLPWDEATHPNVDLATVHITETFSDADTAWMAYEVTNLPKPTLSLLPAASLDDYNSLNYMRKQSIWAIRVRRFMHRIFGAPRTLPDDAAYNQNLPGM